MALILPVSSILADRFPRKLVMLGSDLTRAVLVLSPPRVIAAGGPALAVYGLAIATAIAATPFRPAQAALLPGLARDPGRADGRQRRLEHDRERRLLRRARRWAASCSPCHGHPDRLHLQRRDVPLVGRRSSIRHPAAADRRVDGRGGAEGRGGPGVPARRPAPASGRSSATATSASSSASSAPRRSSPGRCWSSSWRSHSTSSTSASRASATSTPSSASAGSSAASSRWSSPSAGKLALDFGIGVMLWSAPLLAVAAWPTVWVAVHRDGADRPRQLAGGHQRVHDPSARRAATRCSGASSARWRAP